MRYRIGRCLCVALLSVNALAQVAIARDRGAGIGYSNQSDVSHCATSLVTETEGDRINIRQGPSTDYDAQHYGLSGDWIDLLNRDGNANVWLFDQDDEGYSWYQVGFPNSRAYGWVRVDLLELPPEECRN